MEMNELMYTPHWPNPEQRQQHKLEQESKCKKVLSALTVSCSNHCQQAARTAIRPQEPNGGGDIRDRGAPTDIFLDILLTFTLRISKLVVLYCRQLLLLL